MRDGVRAMARTGFASIGDLLLEGVVFFAMPGWPM